MVIYQLILTLQLPALPLKTVLYCHCFFFNIIPSSRLATKTIPLVKAQILLKRIVSLPIKYIGSITPEIFSGHTENIYGDTSKFYGTTVFFLVETKILQWYTENLYWYTENSIGATIFFSGCTMKIDGGTTKFIWTIETAMMTCRKLNMILYNRFLNCNYGERLFKPK